MGFYTLSRFLELLHRLQALESCSRAVIPLPKKALQKKSLDFWQIRNRKNLGKFGKWSRGTREEAHRRQDTAERRQRVGCAWCKTIWPSDSAHFQVRGDKLLTVAAGYACSSLSPFWAQTSNLQGPPRPGLYRYGPDFWLHL